MAGQETGHYIFRDPGVALATTLPLTLFPVPAVAPFRGMACFPAELDPLLIVDAITLTMHVIARPCTRRRPLWTYSSDARDVAETSCLNDPRLNAPKS